VKQTDQVAPQPTAPIDISFRVDTFEKIGEKISCRELEGIGDRHIAFAYNVCRIDHLRVPEPNLAALAAFYAKVDSPDEVRPDNPAVAAQRSAEVQVFLPAIQRQALVEA
jgi:hypothetical protein